MKENTQKIDKVETPKIDGDTTVVNNVGAPERTHNLDFYGMLNVPGTTFQSILQAERDHNADISLPSQEVLLEQNPELKDVEDFNTFYNGLNNLHSQYLNYSSIVNDHYDKSFLSEYTDFDIRPDTDPTTMLVDGKQKRFLTYEETAFAVGKYLNEDGTKWIDMENRFDADGYLTVVHNRSNPDAPPTFFKEVNKNSYVSGVKMLSRFGPSSVVTDNALESVGRGLVGGVAVAAKGLGSSIEAVGDLFHPETDNKWSDNVGHRLMNYGNYYTHQNLDEAGNPFGDYNSFLWNVFNGVAQVSSIIATGGITGSAASAMGFGLKTSGLIAESSGLLLGAVEGGSGVYEEMKDLGFSEEESAKWFFPFAAGTLISEMVLGANVAQRAWGRTSRASVRDHMAKSLGNASSISKATGNRVAAQKRSFATKYYRELREFADKNAYTRVGVGSIEEGLEEYIEGGIHYGLSNLVNSLKVANANDIINRYGKYTFEKIDHNKMGLTLEQAGIEGKGKMYSGMMYSPEQEYIATDEEGNSIGITYDEYKAIQDDLSKANGVVSGTGLLHEGFNLSEGAIASISTLLTLGFGGVTNTMGIRNRKIQDFNEAQQAFDEMKSPRREKQMNEGLQDWVVKYSGHLKGQKSSGEPTSDVNTSSAQDLANAVRSRIDTYKNIIQVNGFDNSETLSKIGGVEFGKELVVLMTDVIDMKSTLENAEDKNAVNYNDQVYTEEQFGEMIAMKEDGIKHRSEITEHGTTEFMRMEELVFNMTYSLYKDINMQWTTNPEFKKAFLDSYHENNGKISEYLEKKKLSSEKFNVDRLFLDEFTQEVKSAGLPLDVTKGTIEDIDMSLKGKAALKNFESIMVSGSNTLRDLTAKIKSLRTIDGKLADDVSYYGGNTDYNNALSIISKAVKTLNSSIGLFYSNEGFETGTDKEGNPITEKFSPDAEMAIHSIGVSGGEIEEAVEGVKKFKADKAKVKSKPKESKEAGIINYLSQNLLDQVNDIRKEYSKDKKSLSTDGNVETVKAAVGVFNELKSYLRLKTSANKTDQGKSAVSTVRGDITSEETYAYQSENEVKNLAGNQLETEGNKLSTAEIKKMNKILDDVTNGTESGDITIDDMSKVLGVDKASLKQREKSRRLATVINQLRMLKKLDSRAGFFSAGVLTDVEELYAEVEKFKAKLDEKKGELMSSDVIQFEKSLVEIKTKMHIELNQNKTAGKNYVLKSLIELARTYKITLGEKYNYSKNEDGMIVSEDNIDAGFVYVGNDVVRFDVGDPFKFANVLLQKSKGKKNSDVLRNKNIAKNVLRKSISKHTLLLNELLYVNNEEFYKVYRGITDSYVFEKDDRFLSIQQEDAIKYVYMDHVSHDNLFIIGDIRVSNQNEKTWKAKLKELGYSSDIASALYSPGNVLSGLGYHPAMKGIFVQGTGGAGKTTFVLKTAMAMINNHLEQNKIAEKQIIHVGPNKSNTDTQRDSVRGLSTIKSGSDYTLSEFIRRLDEKQVNLDKDVIIVIDEVSLLYMNDMNILRDVEGSGVKIIALGDPQQPKYSESGSDNSTGVLIDNQLFRTNLITEVHRASVPMIASLQEAIGRSMVKLEGNEIGMPSYLAFNSNHTKGVLVVDHHKGISGIEKQFKSDLEKHSSVDRVIIFSKEKEADRFKKNNSGINPEQILFIEPTDPKASNDSAQGKEYKYVYAAITLNTKLHDLRILKTAVGRGEKFVAMLGDPASSSLNNNVIDISDSDSEHSAINKKNENELFADQNTRIDELSSVSVKYTAETNTNKIGAKDAPIAYSSTVKDNREQNKTLIKVWKKYLKDNKKSLDDITTLRLTDLLTKVENAVKAYDYDNAELHLKEMNDVALSFEDKKVDGDGTSTSARMLSKSEGYKLLSYDPETVVYNKDGVSYLFLAAIQEDGDSKIMLKNVSDNKILTYPLDDMSEFEIEAPYDIVQTEGYAGRTLEVNESMFANGHMPISVAVMPATNSMKTAVDKSTLEKVYAKELRKRVTASHTDMSLVFHPVIDLYDLNTGEINENYNVITIESSGETLGVLFQPINNDDELEAWNRGERKSRVPANKSFYNPNLVDMSITGANYASELNKIYLKGIEDYEQSGKTGSIKFHEFTGSVEHTANKGSNNALDTEINSAVQYDFSRENSVRGFITDVIENGGAVKGENGNAVSDTRGKILISQIRKREGLTGGYISDFIYVKRVNDNEFAWIPVEIKGQKITDLSESATESLKKRLTYEKKQLNKLAKDATAKTGSKQDQATAFRVFTMAMNDSFMFQSLLYNRSFFLNKNIISDSYNRYLKFEDNKIDVKKTSDVNSIVKNLSQAYELLLTHKGYYPSFKTGFIGGSDKAISLNNDFLRGSSTHAVQLRTGSSFLMDFDIDNQNEGPSVSTNPMDAMPAVKNSSDRVYSPVEKDLAIEYFTRVFGEDFVNNKLGFKSNVIVNGEQAYGATENLRVLVEIVKGRVQEGIGEHEAVHYALRHFVSTEGYKSILRDAKSLMSDDSNNITDAQANEFIAEVNEGLHKVKPTTILGKFVAWFKRVYDYIIGNRFTVTTFLKDLNNGKFKNLHEEFRNGTMTEAMHKNIGEHISLQDRAEAAADIFMEKEFGAVNVRPGKKSRSEMAAIVKGDSNLNDILYLFKSILRNSDPSRRAINDNTVVEIKDYVKLIKSGLNQVYNARSAEIKRLGSDAQNISLLNGYKEKIYFLTQYIKDDEDFIESGLALTIEKINMDENAVDATNESNWDDFDNTNISSKMSSILKNHLETIHFNQFSVKSTGKNTSIKDISSIVNTGGRIPMSKLMSLITETFSSFRLEVSSTADPATRFFNTLYNNAVKGLSEGQNENTNLALSFLLDIGYIRIENGKVKKGIVQKSINQDSALKPYNYFADSDKIFKGLGYNSSRKLDEGFADPTSLASSVKTKMLYAADLINSFMSLYASAQTLNHISVETKFDEEDNRYYQSKKKFNTNVDDVKRIFMNAMFAKFYSKNGLRESVEGKILPKNRLKSKPNNTLSVEGNSIMFYSSAKKVEEIISYNEYTGKWEWQAGKNQELLDKLLKFIGIYVGTNTRRALLGINYDSSYSIDDLADGMGAMFTALRSYYETNPENVYKKRLDNYIAKNKLTVVTRGEMISETNDVEEEPVGDIHLNTFFDTISRLAEVETYMNTIVKRSYSYSPSGKAHYQNVLGNFLSKMFTSADANNSSGALKASFFSAIDGLSKEELEFVPFIEVNEDGSYTVLESLLNGSINVSSLEYSHGIEDKYNPKDIKEMTSTDMYNHTVFGHFLTSFIRESQEQILKMSTISLSDSGYFPIFSVKFGNDIYNDLFNAVKTDGKVTGITTNNKLLSELFDNKFRLNLNKMRISLNKWTGYNFKTNEYSKDADLFNVITPALQKRLSTTKTISKRAEIARKAINDYLHDKGQMSNTNENKQKLSVAGMIENVDFRIEKRGVSEYIQIGHNASMNYSANNLRFRGGQLSPFSLDNYQVWEDISNTKDENVRYEKLADLVDVMMNDRLSLFRDHLKATNNGLPEIVNISDWGKRFYRKLAEPKVIKETAKYSIKKEHEYNPLHRAFVYSYFLFNDSLTNTILANEFQADDPQKIAKYGKSSSGQGWSANVDGAVPITTLNKTFNVTRVLDDNHISKHFKEKLGIGRSYQSTDGLMITNRLFTHFLQKSYGGNISYMQQNDNTLKTIATGMDFSTGLGQYKKSSNMTLNDDLYNHNREAFNGLMQYFMEGNHKNVSFNSIGDNESNLWIKYNEFLETEKTPSKIITKLADYVVNMRIAYKVDLLEGTVSRIEFVSTSKFYSPKTNYMSLDEAIKGNALIDTQKTEDELFVLNANQSIRDREVTDLSQIKLISGIDSSIGLKISNIDGELTERKFKSLKKRFGEFVYDTFEEEFRKLGHTVINKIKGASTLNDLLNVPGISIQIPTIYGKLWPSYVRQFTSAIDQKVTGSKMVQEPGDKFIHYYNIETEDGIVRATQEDIDNKLYRVKKGTTRSPLDHTIISDERITPAEVAMPFFWSDRFGIDETKRHSLNSILNFVVEGKNINLRAYLKSKVADYYTDKIAVKEALNDFMKDNFKKFDDKSFYKSNIDDSINLETAEALADYYESFLGSLDVFAARIPSTLKGLAFSGEIASFTYDSGTTIYVNSSKTLIDDSDYDIDQLTVLFREIKNNDGVVSTPKMSGTSYSNETDSALKNEKFNLLYDDWIDIKQKDHLFITLDISGAKTRAEKNLRNSTMLNHDFPSTVKNFIASHTGKRMVAVFANMIHVYTKLNQLSETARAEHIKRNISFNDKGLIETGDTVEYIIQTLGEMLQMSVDNPKLMILDLLNVNTESGSFIGALAISGLSRAQIYNMLENKDVKDMFKKALSGKSVGSISYSAIEHLENKINLLDAQDEFKIMGSIKDKRVREQGVLGKLLEMKTQGIKFTQVLSDEEQTEDVSVEFIKQVLKDSKVGKQFGKLSSIVEKSEGTVSSMVEDLLQEMISDKRITVKDGVYSLKEKDKTTEYTDEAIRNVVRTRYLVNNKAFLKQAGNLLTDIDKKIEASRQLLKYYDEGNSEYFIEQERLANEKQVVKLNSIYDYMVIGDAIRRVIPILRLNKKVPSDQYGLYDLVNKIEFGTGVTLAHLNNKKVANTYRWQDNNNYRIKTIRQNDWDSVPQSTVNVYAETFVSKLLDRIAKSDMNSNDMSIVTTAESGFGEAFAKAFANKDVGITIYHEKGNRYTTENRNNEFDYKDREHTPSMDRFNDINNRTNVTNESSEKTGQMSLWHHATKKDVLGQRKAAIDVQMIFNPFNQNMYDSMHNIHSDKSFNAKNALINNDEEHIDTLVNEMFTRMEDSSNANKQIGGKGKVVIGVMGTDMGAVNTNRLSSYQRWLEREQNIRGVFPDMAGMVRKFKNISSYLKIVEYLNNEKEHFFWDSEFAQSLEAQYLETQKKDRFSTAAEYHAFKTQMQNAVVDNYFKNLTDDSFTKMDLTRYKTKQVVGAYGVNMDVTKSKKINLTDYMSSLYFVLEFPRYVQALQDQQLHVENGRPNMFIDNLIVDEDNLVIKNHNTLTEMELGVISEEFKKLDDDTKKKFYAYNLLRNGFNMGGYFSLTNFIGDFMAADIGHTVEGLSKDSKFLNDMKKYFVTNAIPNDKNLYRFYSKKRKDDFQPPAYSLSYKTYKTDQFTGKKHQYSVPSYLMSIDDSGIPIYGEIYNELSLYVKRLPVTHHTNAEDEVVKLSDVEDFRKWNDNETATLFYDYAHNFNGMMNDKGNRLGYIKVNVDKARLTNSFDNRLTITKVEAKEYQLKRLEKGEPDPVASKPLRDIKQRSMSKNTLRNIVDLVKNYMPVSIVNNKTTHYADLHGYIHSGELLINEDLATMDTIFHEIGHIFLWINNNSRIMSIAEAELENETDLAMRIKDKYPQLNKQSLIFEIGATLIGLTSQNKIEAFIGERGDSFVSRTMKSIKSFWNDVVSYLGYLFGVNVEINSDDTLNDVVEKLMSDVRSGKFSTSSQEVQALQDKYEATLTASKKITNAKDLADLLLVKNTDKTVKEFIVDSHTRYLWNKIKASLPKNQKLKAGNFSYDFGELVKENDIDEATRIIRDEYIPELHEEGSKIKNNFLKWLSNTADGGNAQESNIKHFFKLGGLEHTPKFTNSMVNLAKAIGWSPSSTVMSIKDLAKIAPEFKGVVPNNLDIDAMIIVHRYEKTESGGLKSIDISILKDFPYKVSFGAKGLSGSLVSSNFMTDADGKSKGVTMQATQANIEKINLMAFGMLLKAKMGSSINIRSMGVSEMDDTNSLVTYSPVNVVSVLGNIRGLSKSDDFLNSIPREMAMILTGDRMYDINIYSPNYFESLLSMFNNSYYNSPSDGNKMIPDIKTSLEKVIAGQGSVKHLMKALRHYKHTLDQKLSNDQTSKDVNAEEYEMISLALFEMNTQITMTTGNVKDVGLYSFLFMNQADQKNRVVQSFYNTMRNELNIISGLFEKEQNKLAVETEKIMAIHKSTRKGQKFWEYLIDKSEDYFDKFFIYQNIDGKRVNTFTIHHDRTNPATINALRSNELSEEEFKYSQFIAEQVETQVKNLLRAQFKYTYKVFKDGTFNEQKLEQMVEDYYTANWEKGRMPLMRKSTSTYIKEGKLLEAKRKFVYQTSNPEKIFEDVLQDEQDLIESEKVSSVFLSQIGGFGDSIYGSDSRMSNLGLESVNGNFIVREQKAGTIYTQNLFNIAKYITMDGISKPILEDRLLPAYKEAQVAAKAMKVFNSTDKGRTADHLRVMFEKSIIGKHQKEFEDSPLWDSVSGWGRMAIKITTFNGVALSLPVAVTSLTANTFETIVNSMATNISGANPYQIFGMQHWASAVKEYTVNYSKVKAIMDHYQVIEADRWDFLMNPVHDVTFKSPWHSNAAHFMNRWTDISTRAMAAVAQMKFEGTWNAHSVDEDGNVHYNPEKDTRINNWKKDRKQKEHRDWLVENLLDDERTMDEQEGKSMPVRAYDVQDQRKLEHVGSQFVVGVYNQEASTNGSSFFLIQMLMQFKKFMTTKIAERLGHKIDSFEGGAKIITEKENGELVRAWKNYEKEGSWKTAAKILTKSFPFTASVLVKTQWVNDVHTLGQWNKMSDLEKYNLTRTALDLIMIGTAYLAYMGFDMMAEFDDDLAWTRRFARIMRAFKDGMMTAILTAPNQMMDMFGSIPTIDMAKTIMDLVLFIDPIGNIKHMAPLGGTVKTGIELFSSDEDL